MSDGRPPVVMVGDPYRGIGAFCGWHPVGPGGQRLPESRAVVQWPEVPGIQGGIMEMAPTEIRAATQEDGAAWAQWLASKGLVQADAAPADHGSILGRVVQMVAPVLGPILGSVQKAVTGAATNVEKRSDAFLGIAKAMIQRATQPPPRSAIFGQIAAAFVVSAADRVLDAVGDDAGNDVILRAVRSADFAACEIARQIERMQMEDSMRPATETK